MYVLGIYSPLCTIPYNGLIEDVSIINWMRQLQPQLITVQVADVSPISDITLNSWRADRQRNIGSSKKFQLFKLKIISLRLMISLIYSMEACIVNYHTSILIWFGLVSCCPLPSNCICTCTLVPAGSATETSNALVFKQYFSKDYCS